MPQATPRIYWLLFSLLSVLYSLSQKLQHLYSRLVRFFYYNVNVNSDNERCNKLEENLHNLGKVPKQVVLAVDSRGRTCREMVQGVGMLVEVCGRAGVDDIVMFVWGNTPQQTQTLSQTLKQSNPTLTQPPKFLSFDQLHRNLQKFPSPAAQTSVPLLFSMCQYTGLNCIPYPLLIDAEIVFCPPVQDCTAADIVRGFEIYAASKQRHGR